MSWTAPRTWVTDEVVSASQLNTHVRDNMLETAPALVTTAGDLVYADGANSLVRLAANNPGDRLRVNTAGTALVWDAVILDRDLTQTENETNSGGYGHWSYEIAANELGATGGVRLTISGDYLNNTGVDRDLQITVTFGASTILNSGSMVIPANSERRQWRLELIGMNSATGAQKWMTFWSMSQADTLTFAVADPDGTNDSRGTAGRVITSEDTTGALTLAFLSQHSASYATLSCRKEIAILEKLPAA